MKDIYYGDNRDIVKWAGIVHLCNITGIKDVVHVAYYRPSQPLMEFLFDGTITLIPKAVGHHFTKDIQNIKGLASVAGIKIQVLMMPFNHGIRKLYHDETTLNIKKVAERKIVFLDPDTGLNTRAATASHVQPEELQVIWQSLKSEDFLVLYQHALHEAGWRETKKKELAKACKVQPDQVKEWQSSEVGDVIFFFIKKL